jgi:prepilin signal peptidase PulO-like enzyme (type II secretory pathway)
MLYAAAFCLLPTAYWLSLTSDCLPPAAFCLLAVWLFAAGGIIGSFLNVVVYRLPAGISIVSPGSHCPKCKRPIRWFDNVPILAWLWLGGRCRDCRTAISPRYPLIEVATAAIFLAVGMADYLSSGVDLLAGPEDGSGASVLSTPGVVYLLTICAWHLMLLCTLLCAALIDYDRQPVPWRLFVPALVVGIVAAPLWPLLRPLPVWPAWHAWPRWVAGLCNGVVGLTAGLLLGQLAATLARSKPSGLLLGTACVGLYLGWQAACALTLATMVIHLSLRALGRWAPAVQRIPATAWLLATTLAWILFGAHY